MGLKIVIDIDLMNLHKLTPTTYVMLYYLHNKLDCKISPQTKTDLYNNKFIDTEGNITSLGKSIFTDPDVISEEKKQDYEELLKKMVSYFPKGVKTAGKPVKTSVNAELVQKMKKFKKEYKYNDETILNATIKYVEECKKNNYAYMRQFKYFIYKQGSGSDLADYCEMISNGENITTNGRNTKTL